MTVYLLPEEPVFPDPCEADEDGLIAIGGDLSVERLIVAYSSGIFPWFIHEDEPYWYSPNPRMVLFPDKMRISGSLQRVISSGKFSVRIDTSFEKVIRACSEAYRTDQDGTWISEEFISAYNDLYKMGVAHSIETFYRDELVGGLYGLSLGAAFFGESMFFKERDASKVAFAALADTCRKRNITFIDCQVESAHLQKFGAALISRDDYLRMLKQSLDVPANLFQVSS